MLYTCNNKRRDFFEENRTQNNSTVVMFFITKAELNFKKLKLNFIGAEDFK
jgi:hypothetical protein